MRMQWTWPRVRRAVEPVAALVVMVGMQRLMHIGKVQSFAGAALAGIGIALLMMSLLLALHYRFKHYGAGPMLNPWCLVWSGPIGVVAVTLLEIGKGEWRYAGFALLFVSGLYAMLGGIAVIREIDREPRDAVRSNG